MKTRGSYWLVLETSLHDRLDLFRSFHQRKVWSGIRALYEKSGKYGVGELFGFFILYRRLHRGFKVWLVSWLLFVFDHFSCLLDLCVRFCVCVCVWIFVVVVVFVVVCLCVFLFVFAAFLVLLTVELHSRDTEVCQVTPSGCRSIDDTRV